MQRYNISPFQIATERNWIPKLPQVTTVHIFLHFFGKFLMGRLARSRKHHGIRDNKRKFQTKTRTKDLDQIQSDMLKVEQHRINRMVDTDDIIPGIKLQNIHRPIFWS
jgi:hypothetical protein